MTVFLLATSRLIQVKSDPFATLLPDCEHLDHRPIQLMTSFVHHKLCAEKNNQLATSLLLSS